MGGSELRVLILGARGLLGSDLLPLLTGRGHEVWGRDFGDFDIADAGRVEREIKALKPDAVINAAAYNDVDGCEGKRDWAFAVNAGGAGNVARGCSAVGAKMVYLSTDYVFDGSSGTPYKEQDFANPLNVYGSSKLQGERFIQEILENYLIIRTEWLYGRQGRSFVSTLLQLAEEGGELRVVDDQRGSPTFTKDLGWAIQLLLEVDVRGIVHVTNSGCCSWFEFARRIFEEKGYDRRGIRLLAISSEELGRPAKRPANSELDCSRFGVLTGQKMRGWEEALNDFLCG